MDLPLVCLSGLVYMLSNSLQAVEMDGKDDYINAVGYISSSLSETELALQQLSEEMFTSFRGWKAQTYRFAGISCVKEKSHRDFFVQGKYIVEKGIHAMMDTWNRDRFG